MSRMTGQIMDPAVYRKPRLLLAFSFAIAASLVTRTLASDPAVKEASRPFTSASSTPPAPHNAPDGNKLAEAVAPAWETDRGLFRTPPLEAPSREVPSLLTETAQEHVRYGYDLGQRGAVHSAKAEFLRALQLVVWSLDKGQQTNLHSEALAAALLALEEADDFNGGQAGWIEGVDVAAIAATHKTDVLRASNTGRTTAIDAIQLYYQHAKELLRRAAAGDPVASRAIQGLARVEVARSNVHESARSTAAPKAIALYQAAVLVDPANGKAAGELGVVLARFGQLRQAQQALRHSLSVYPDATTWGNLAFVYEQLGEIELAQAARQNSVTANSKAAGSSSTVPQSDPDTIVQWVDRTTFADRTAPEPRPSAVPTKAASAPEDSPHGKSAPRSSWTGIFKNLIPRDASAL